MQRRNGFTLVELAIALIFAAILLGIAVNAFGSVQNRTAASQAVMAFQSMHARARAQAIESGTNVSLIIHSAGDSVSINRLGNPLEVIRFDDEMGVEVTASPGIIVLCMSPRGYANLDCNNFSDPVKVQFSMGDKAETVQILPMGQLVRQ